MIDEAIRYDSIAHMELHKYFCSTPIEERQNSFLVYSPRALRFFIVPVKEKGEDNLNMFENGISLGRYLDEQEEKRIRDQKALYYELAIEFLENVKDAAIEDKEYDSVNIIELTINELKEIKNKGEN